MSDTPLEYAAGGPYDRLLEVRVSRLEVDMRDIRAVLGRLEPMIVEMRATLPHLATKAELAELRAELAEKPSKTYMWGVLTALVTAYAAGLAALAILR
jgi:hypothetical protein